MNVKFLCVLAVLVAVLVEYQRRYSDFCLACGQVILPSNERLLCSENSPISFTIYQVWRDLLAERLKPRFVEAEVESMVRRTPFDIVCKSCFWAMKSFHERNVSF